jgi:hypothetical protein
VKRALIVVLIALFIASVSGINDASLASEPQAAPAGDAHQQAIASRVGKIGVNRVVKIERTDGTTANALLEEVLPDAITVTIMEKENRRRETIPFAQIKKIDEVRGHTLRNVLIGVGIGVAVLVGTCAAALSSTTSPISSKHRT